jgi:hypothetical protein
VIDLIDVLIVCPAAGVWGAFMYKAWISNLETSNRVWNSK